MSNQSSLLDFISYVKEKKKEGQFRDLSWELIPDNLYNLYQIHAIDRNYAVYILKILFHETEEKWNTIKERNTIIKYVVEISKKDEALRTFLEGIFLTEWRYDVRLEALLFLIKYFTKTAKKLYDFRRDQDGDGFLYYVLRKFKTSKLLPFVQIIDDPLFKIYILNKSTLDYGFYYNFSKNKIIRYRDSKSFIQISKGKQKLTRFKTLKLFSNKEILTLPVKSFVLESGRPRTWIHDLNDKNPQLIFYEQKIENGMIIYFTIKEIFMKEFITSLKKEFGLKDKDFKYSLLKTQTIYLYLILEIKKINLYMRYFLSHYKKRAEDERNE